MITGARATVALGLVTLSLLAGCGLRGPLYLPDSSDQAATPAGEEDGEGKEETRKRRTPPQPAPQSQKEGDAAPTATSDPDRSATPPPPKP
jgi:predicted small lipoprotein YifL